MDRLLSMRVFTEVVNEGSFSGAARTLDLSPAAVTRLVADLEDHLSIRLLQRSTRRLALTEAGDLYLKRVRQILQDVDDAEALAGQSSNDLSGVLRVQAPPVLASYHIAPLLKEFRERYPEIRIDLDVWAPKDPPIEDYDLTLLVADQHYDANVIARKVIESQAVLVTSPEYLRRRGTPSEPKDLMEHDCLLIKPLGVRTKTWKLWRVQNPDQPVVLEVKAVVWANHTSTLLQAALDGAGITSAPIDLVAPYLARGELVRVLAPWITGQLTVYAAVPSRKYIPRRTQVFFDFMVEKLRAQVASVINNCANCHDDDLMFIESTGSLEWPQPRRDAQSISLS
jgi:DNA-binding transcriptional LysR family regulator